MSILSSQQPLPLDVWRVILSFCCDREGWMVVVESTYRRMQILSEISRNFLGFIRSAMRLSSPLFLSLPVIQKNLMVLNVESLAIKRGRAHVGQLERMTNLWNLYLDLSHPYPKYRFSTLTNLTTLSIIMPSGENGRDLMNLSRLVELRLMDPMNEIEDLHVSHMTKLEVLSISHNTRIKLESIQRFKKLFEFRTGHPRASSNLNELLRHLNDDKGENMFPNLSALCLGSPYRPIDGMHQLSKLSSQLTHLVLDSLNTTTHIVKELTALESLQLDEVLFTETDMFVNLTRLHTLSVYNCIGLSDSILSKATSLQTLIIRRVGDNSDITDQSLTCLTNLTRLELHSRKPILSYKSLSSLSELSFKIEDSCITNQLLASLTNLRKLGMETFNGYVTPGLIEIVCEHMIQLTSLSLSYTCRSMNGYDTSLESVLHGEIGKLTNLTHLRMDHTSLFGVTYDDILPLTRLRYVEIGHDDEPFMIPLIYSEYMEQLSYQV